MLAGPDVATVLAAAIRAGGTDPPCPVTAAIVSCAFSGAGVITLAAEGLFILGDLLAADALAAMARPGEWLRHPIPLFVAGLIATGSVPATYAVRPPAEAWLAVAGLAAAVAACLIALPPRLGGLWPLRAGHRHRRHAIQ